MIVSDHPQIKNFLKIAKLDLSENQITIKKFKKKIDPNFEYQGYFDEENKEIGILMKKKRWLSMFVHEYAHYLQWKFDNPTYTAYNSMQTDPIVTVENYVSKKSNYDENVKKSFLIIRKNEVDCDRIACDVIRKYNLPIDIVEYKKEANLQLVFYHCVEKTKIWNVSNLYNTKMMNMMPGKLQYNYAVKIPDKIFDTAMEYFE